MGLVTPTSQIPLRLLKLFLFHRWPARLVVFFLSLAGALIGVASPLFQKIFIDGLLGTTSVESRLLSLPPISPLTAIGLAFICTLLTQVLGTSVAYLCTREGSILQSMISDEMYRKMLSIRTGSMGSTTVGEVVSIYATDVPGSAALIDQVLPMAISIFLYLAVAPVAIHFICGIPLAATLIVMGTIVLLMLTLATRQSRFFARYKQLGAERAGLVNEWVQTIRLLRILGWVEYFERKIFSKRQQETANRVAMVTNGQLMNSFGSSINFVLSLIGVATLIYMSGRQATPGDLFAMLWIFGVFLVRAFRQLPWFFTFSLDSLTSMRRLEEFLARPSDAGGVEISPSPKGNLVVDGLGLSVRGLSYSASGQSILSDVDFDIAPGEFVAVVGEVGSGKSSLALSLLGETAAIFKTFKIGDRDVASMSLPERRRFFSFVGQEGFVMSASLRENVAFRYDPLDEDNAITHSLEVSSFRLGDEIAAGAGLATEIGERGVNLSGGQRQRVALARAHQFQRPIIVLDDCLSAVDVDTERELVKGLLNGAWQGRTRILVTHRLSVLRSVDRVFFMEDGRIIEQGPFIELLRRSEKVRAFAASVKRGEQIGDGDATCANLERLEDQDEKASESDEKAAQLS